MDFILKYARETVYLLCLVGVIVLMVTREKPE